MIATLHVDALPIPSSAFTFEGFVEWYGAQPEGSPAAHYVQGEVFLEMSPQNLYSHLPVVSEINRVLGLLARELGIGRYFEQGGWIVHREAGLSTEPDGMLLRWETLRSGAVRVAEHRADQLLGRPDMVLEVASATSERKDTKSLITAYAAAGVREYWLADARGKRLSLQIFVLVPAGTYRAQKPDADGWVSSPTWSRRFRLVAETDPLGERDVRLEVAVA